MNITQEDWDEWKSMGVTKEFFAFLIREMVAHQEIASNGGCIAEDFDITKTGSEYIRRITHAVVYYNLINIQFDEIIPIEEIEDAEDSPSRPSSSY